MMLSPINYKIERSETSMGSLISLWSLYKQFYFFSIQPKDYKLFMQNTGLMIHIYISIKQSFTNLFRRNGRLIIIDRMMH
jgi:hypothetical protein